VLVGREEALEDGGGRPRFGRVERQEAAEYVRIVHEETLTPCPLSRCGRREGSEGRLGKAR
jgi:hypothetical protein